MNKGFIKFTNKEPCFSVYDKVGVQLLPNEEYVIIINTPFEYSTSLKAQFVCVDGSTYNLTQTEVSPINSTSFRIKKMNVNNSNRGYLKVILDNSVICSNMFLVSDYNKHLTTRIDYKCKVNDGLQSIRVKMYEWQEQRAVEIETYKEISTSNQVSKIDVTNYFEYKINDVDKDTTNSIIDVFKNRYVYFNYDRVNLYDAPEFELQQGYSKLVEGKINVTKLGENIEPIYNLVTEITEDNIVTEINSNNIIKE